MSVMAALIIVGVIVFTKNQKVMKLLIGGY